MTIPRYIVLEKAVGETPLYCAEAWRSATGISADIPLAYAGRLDPMASGKLLVLIGDECKVQERYHGLDKRYEFSVLFGVGSDTGDVLGRLTATPAKHLTPNEISSIAKSLTGNISLPYPHFSAKTVQGKPLHMWTLEGRLHEITIPTQSSVVYSLTLTKLETKTRATIYADVSVKIETIPKVTEARKALGNDFRRTDVRADWANFNTRGNQSDEFQIATFACIASSGTYMRSLAEEIGKLAGTSALAYHIHRTHIGTYRQLLGKLGFWTKKY